MAGNAKTNNFLLSTATVMIGPEADLHDLNPTDHSIGLVKNFAMTSEPEYTELMQGVKNNIVFSTMTSNPVNCSMEVYEYTAKNFNYALGLNGNGVTANTVETTVSGAVSADATTVDVASATGLSAGDYIMIHQDNLDNFVVRKIASIAVDELTLEQAVPAIADGTKVTKVNAVNIGSKDDQPFLSAKVAGKLANGQPIVIQIPKIRITRGFNMSFTSDDYSNLPFEFTLYDLVSTDTFYSEFKNEQARIYTKN